MKYSNMDCDMPDIPTLKSLDANKGDKAAGAEAATAQETAQAAEGAAAQEKCCTAEGAPCCQEEAIDFSKVEIEPLFKDYVDFETFSKSDFRAVKVLECEAVPKSKKLLKFVLDDGTGENRVILSGIHAFYEPERLI